MDIPSPFLTKDYGQIYINAHGHSPVSRKSITLDGHNYRRDISKTFFGRVPDNTLLVTCTPPNNSLMVDKNENIIKEIIKNLSSKKLDYLINLQNPNKYDGYLFDLLEEIQIYEPGDMFYNQEVVFENSKINNIYKLDNNEYTKFIPIGRKYYGMDSKYKIMVDTRTNPEIDPILDKTNKYGHYWDSNYIPYSLSGLINLIRKECSKELVVVYAFICNPRGDPHDITHKLYLQVNELYQTGKKKCEKYREYYFYKNRIRNNKRLLIIQQFLDSPISSYNYTPFEYDELKISDLDNTDWDIYIRDIIKKEKECIEKKSRDGRLKKRNVVLRNVLLLKND